MPIRKVEDLEVYQRAKRLYPEVVQLTQDYSPKSFYLRDQSCRACNGISAHIAEGFGRSVAEFKRYLTIAIGSGNELKSHLENALAVRELKQEEFDKIINEINILGRKLYTLRKIWQ